MKTEVMTITPEMAKTMLEKNFNNRSLRQATLSRYVDDMINGRWCLTHQGIALFDDGSLADGQHRLQAIVISGVTVTMMVSTIPKKSAIAIDMHASRTANDAIRISGGPEWIDRITVAVCRVLMDEFSPTAFPFSAADVESFAIKNEQFIRPATGLVVTKTRGNSSAGFIACLACAICGCESMQKMKRIMEIMITGEIASSSENAIIRLREFSRSDMNANMWNKDNRLCSAKKAQRAISAFCKGEPLGKLYEPSELIYPIVGKNNRYEVEI